MIPPDGISPPKTCFRASLRSSILLCWRQRFSKSDSTSCRACDVQGGHKNWNLNHKSRKWRHPSMQLKWEMGWNHGIWNSNMRISFPTRKWGHDDWPWDFGVHMTWLYHWRVQAKPAPENADCGSEGPQLPQTVLRRPAILKGLAMHPSQWLLDDGEQSCCIKILQCINWAWIKKNPGWTAKKLRVTTQWPFNYLI